MVNSATQPIKPTSELLGAQVPAGNTSVQGTLRQGVYYFLNRQWVSIVPLIIQEIAASLKIAPQNPGSITIQTTTSRIYQPTIPNGFTIDIVFLGSGKLNSPTNGTPGYSWDGINLELTQSSVKTGTELSITLKPL